jgi:amino-acid N-acetyltransferase
METQIRRALATDVPEIQRLINSFADRDQMLPRSLNELYENLRDYFVVEDQRDVVGCCALHVTWADLCEVKGLAVREDHWGHGLGRQLVERCIEDARRLGLPRVFVLTYIPEYFERFGFQNVDKADLPQKVWAECIRCPKFPDCGEVSMTLELA